MRLFKSFLFLGILTIGLSALAMPMLGYGSNIVSLPNCQGTARLSVMNGIPYLLVNARECGFIINDMGQREKITPEGYPLQLNHSYVITVTSERGEYTGHVDQFSVSTAGLAPYYPGPQPIPGPGPQPIPGPGPQPMPGPQPIPGYIPSVDLYGSGATVDLPSCGGTVNFHQTFFTETPRLTFNNVTECTYYTVLSAARDAMVLDATQSRLHKESYGWAGQFDLPNRWGTNKVRIRLQSATGEHAVDIFVHFVQR